MNEKSGQSALKLVMFLVALVALYSVALMGLWNWLLPTLFDFPSINYWQALGLLGLSRILFGGFKGTRKMHRRRRRKEGTVHEEFESAQPD